MSEIIQQLWNFDDADLAANRMGQLTAKQKTMLAGELKSYKMVYLGIGIFIAVIFCCVPIIALLGRGLFSTLISGLASPSQNSPADLMDTLPLFAMGGFAVIFIVITVLIVGIVLVVYYIRGNKKEDITVKKAEGVVNFVQVEKRVRTTSNNRGYKDINVLEMRVGTDKKFTEVNDRLPNIINQGEEWTIYYTSHPFKFLSGEIISKGK